MFLMVLECEISAWMEAGRVKYIHNLRGRTHQTSAIMMLP